MSTFIISDACPPSGISPMTWITLLLCIDSQTNLISHHIFHKKDLFWDAISVGVLGISRVNNVYVTLTTHEINRSGYWTFVQRAVFLHKPLPICSVDFVAPSQLHAKGNQRPPSDNFYLRSVDLGKPERVLV
jgi:hypothetical protein